MQRSPLSPGFAAHQPVDWESRAGRTPAAAVPADAAPLIELRGVRKLYGGVCVLDQVDFAVYAGEVHALIGENGAGKSTLIKILAGAVPRDAGELYVGGQPLDHFSARQALDLGIATVYQKPNLVPELSVAENVFLGTVPTRLPLGTRVDWADMRAAAGAILADLGAAVDPRATVASLPVPDQKLVEIARALHRHSQVLILDEPTAALGIEETEHLLAVVDQLRARGKGIVFVSHDLDEVRRLADRITVLRDGQHVVTASAAKLSAAALVQAMVGRELTVAERRASQPAGAPLLALEDLAVPRQLAGFSLAVRAGEVVGVLGAAGGGQSALFALLAGLLQPSAGRIVLRGRAVRLRSPRHAVREGIRVIPPDRMRYGLVPELGLAENATMAALALRPGQLVRWGWLGRRGAHWQETLRIAAAQPHAPVKTLSGGNQQKVLLAKWFEAPGDVYVLDEPTAGVDVGVKHEIHDLVRGLAADGKAVLIASSDVEEILSVSDCIAVVRKGQVVAEVPRELASHGALVAAVTGASSGGG
jgi:ABC-type sugar transport system ATPase subunit